MASLYIQYDKFLHKYDHKEMKYIQITSEKDLSKLLKSDKEKKYDMFVFSEEIVKLKDNGDTFDESACSKYDYVINLSLLIMKGIVRSLYVDECSKNMSNNNRSHNIHNLKSIIQNATNNDPDFEEDISIHEMVKLYEKKLVHSYGMKTNYCVFVMDIVWSKHKDKFKSINHYMDYLWTKMSMVESAITIIKLVVIFLDINANIYFTTHDNNKKMLDQYEIHKVVPDLMVFVGIEGYKVWTTYGLQHTKGIDRESVLSVNQIASNGQQREDQSEWIKRQREKNKGQDHKSQNKLLEDTLGTGTKKVGGKPLIFSSGVRSDNNNEVSSNFSKEGEKRLLEKLKDYFLPPAQQEELMSKGNGSNGIHQKEDNRYNIFNANHSSVSGQESINPQSSKYLMSLPSNREYKQPDYSETKNNMNGHTKDQQVYNNYHLPNNIHQHKPHSKGTPTSSGFDHRVDSSTNEDFINIQDQNFQSSKTKKVTNMNDRVYITTSTNPSTSENDRPNTDQAKYNPTSFNFQKSPKVMDNQINQYQPSISQNKGLTGTHKFANTINSPHIIYADQIPHPPPPQHVSSSIPQYTNTRDMKNEGYREMNSLTSGSAGYLDQLIEMNKSSSDSNQTYQEAPYTFKASSHGSENQQGTERLSSTNHSFQHNKMYSDTLTFKPNPPSLQPTTYPHHELKGFSPVVSNFNNHQNYTPHIGTSNTNTLVDRHTHTNEYKSYAERYTNNLEAKKNTLPPHQVPTSHSTTNVHHTQGGNIGYNTITSYTHNNNNDNYFNTARLDDNRNIDQMNSSNNNQKNDVIQSKLNELRERSTQGTTKINFSNNNDKSYNPTQYEQQRGISTNNRDISHNTHNIEPNSQIMPRGNADKDKKPIVINIWDNEPQTLDRFKNKYSNPPAPAVYTPNQPSSILQHTAPAQTTLIHPNPTYIEPADTQNTHNNLLDFSMGSLMRGLDNNTDLISSHSNKLHSHPVIPSYTNHVHHTDNILRYSRPIEDFNDLLVKNRSPPINHTYTTAHQNKERYQHADIDPFV